MSLFELAEAFFTGGGKTLRTDVFVILLRFACRLVPAFKIALCREINHSIAGFAYMNMIFVIFYFSVSLNRKSTSEAHSLTFAALIGADGFILNLLNVCRADAVENVCSVSDADLVANFAVYHRLEIKLVLTVCGQFVNKNLVGMADEALAVIYRVACRVMNGCHSVLNVKITLVFSRTHMLHRGDCELTEL